MRSCVLILHARRKVGFEVVKEVILTTYFLFNSVQPASAAAAAAAAASVWGSWGEF